MTHPEYMVLLDRRVCQNLFYDIWMTWNRTHASSPAMILLTIWLAVYMAEYPLWSLESSSAMSYRTPRSTMSLYTRSSLTTISAAFRVKYLSGFGGSELQILGETQLSWKRMKPALFEFLSLSTIEFSNVSQSIIKRYYRRFQVNRAYNTCIILITSPEESVGRHFNVKNLWSW